MPNYLHRTTFAKLFSVSPNSLTQPVENYILSPDYTAVTGQPEKYWIITGDNITLMDQAAMDVVDAAELVSHTLADRNTTTAQIDETSALGVEDRAKIQSQNKRDNYLVNRISEIQDALSAVKASTGAAQGIKDAIPVNFLASNTRTLSDAVDDYQGDIDAGIAD